MTAQAQPQNASTRSRVEGGAEGVGPLARRKCACGGLTTSLSSECAECRRKRLGLQAKLAANERGDRHEQEADRVAGAIERAERGTSPQLQTVAQGGAAQREVPEIVPKALASPGRPLDDATRSFYEPRFGVDFSRVRVHTDAVASESAQAIAARAYTVGSQIAFRSGEYSPGTIEGRRLLSHELTHVAQQSAGAAPSLQREPDAKAEEAEKKQSDDEADDPSDDYETGADNEVAPEDDGDREADEDKSFGEEPEPLQNSPKAPTTGKWILVELPGTLIRFEGAKRIGSWGISGGRASNPTPEGSFSIGTRDENHTSSSYGKCDGKPIGPNGKSKCDKKGGKYDGADMYFFQGFAPEVGFHRGDPSVPSHGCIHVSGGNAATLWNWSTKGTPVIVCSGAGCDPFLSTSPKKKKKQQTPKKKKKA